MLDVKGYTMVSESMVVKSKTKRLRAQGDPCLREEKEQYIKKMQKSHYKTVDGYTMDMR